MRCSSSCSYQNDPALRWIRRTSELTTNRSARTKAAAEQMLLSADPTSTIIRPSIVFGPGDSFFNVRVIPFYFFSISSSALNLLAAIVADDTVRSDSQSWPSFSHSCLSLVVVQSVSSEWH